MAERSGQGYLGALRRKRGLMKYDVMDLPGNAFAQDITPYALQAVTPSPLAQRPALSGPQRPDTLRGILSGNQAMPDYPAPFLQPDKIVEQQPVDFQELAYGGQQDAGLDMYEAPTVEVSGSRIGPEDWQSTAQSEGSRTHIDQQNGFGSPLALSLLSAGLGILANNTGHYGQAGPAIGRGGMQGLSTFMQLKQQQAQDDRARAQMGMEKERQQAYMRQVSAQNAAVERANSADTRKQAIIREMFNYPEDSREFKTLTKRLMMETGQFPQYERATAAPAAAQSKAFDIPVNDENGEPVTAPDGRVLWKKSARDPQTGEWKTGTYWRGNVPPKPEDVAARELAKENAQSIAKENDAQKSRVNALDALDYAQQMLDEGIYSGAGAGLKEGASKIAGSIFGSDTSKASRTEQFRAYIGDVVIPQLKALGVAPTDTDLRYLRSVMAEDVTLEEQTLRSVLSRVKKKIERESGQHKNTVRQIQESLTVPNNMRPENQIKPPAARYKEWGIRGQ